MSRFTKLRNKCDRKLQEAGREVYDKCLVCGKPMSCLHHFFPKSGSAALRYHWENLIPLCQNCHFSHHSKSSAEIHVEVIKIKGMDWYDKLQYKKNNTTIKESQTYYENVYKILDTISKAK